MSRKAETADELALSAPEESMEQMLFEQAASYYRAAFGRGRFASSMRGLRRFDKAMRLRRQRLEAARQGALDDGGVPPENPEEVD